MSAARPAPGPRWGWHRLDPSAARRVVAWAGITSGDLVVDLGAGTGALTAAALDAGARVIAVELHPDRVAALRARFAGDPVVVVRADITAVRWPRRPFCVVANPPWALAETVRANLLRCANLRRADLVLPRWLAHRWAARDSRITVGGSLRAEAFTPPAPTGSAIAVVSRRR